MAFRPQMENLPPPASKAFGAHGELNLLSPSQDPKKKKERPRRMLEDHR